MNPGIRPVAIDTTPPRRHDGRVARVSGDPGLLRKLDRLVIGEAEIAIAVGAVCAATDVPEPRIRLHARRSMFTGATEPPRSRRSERTASRGHEPEPAARSARSEHGAVRIGRRTTLMTLAHELGHHLVFHLDPPGTPAHGKVWVGRFDEAAAILAGLVMIDDA